jgi:hypothetical protein
MQKNTDINYDKVLEIARNPQIRHSSPGISGVLNSSGAARRWATSSMTKNAQSQPDLKLKQSKSFSKL